jgi:hypothetical protein
MAVLLRYLTALEAGLDASASMEPLKWSDALFQARVESDSEEAAHIAAFFIPGARQQAESKTGSAIRPAKYRQMLDIFPWSGKDRNGYASGAPFGRQSACRPIKTAHGLVQSIDAISYVDTFGVLQTLDPSSYALVKTDDANTEVSMKFGKAWPQAADVSGAITIEYTAGLAPDEFVSRFPGVVQWLLLAATWSYENRQLMSAGAKDAFNAMPASYVDSLLAPIAISPRF